MEIVGLNLMNTNPSQSQVDMLVCELQCVTDACEAELLVASEAIATHTAETQY